MPPAGRTPRALRAGIVGRIAQYIPEPVVSVELLEARGNKILAIGEVAAVALLPRLGELNDLGFHH